MWPLNQLLSRVIRKGRLTITDYDGSIHEYGPGGQGVEPIRVRLTDKGAAYHIARYPQVGAGEAYMDGRLVIEPPHDIRDLVLFVTENGKKNGGAAFHAKGPWRKAAQKLIARLDSFNPPEKAARNAKHTYNLTRRLYELFLDEDRQYTMAYYRDTSNSLEKAQLDKKAHIAAMMYLKPGM
jgi:cyclopropane-fatty-acyl-phospholipid synthase